MARYTLFLVTTLVLLGGRPAAGLMNYEPVLQPILIADFQVSGMIDAVELEAPRAIYIKAMKISVTRQTLIRNKYGMVSAFDLKVGMNITAYGYRTRDGIFATRVYIAE